MISFSGAAFVWVGMFGKCDFPSVPANPVIPTVSTSISYKIRYIVLKRENRPKRRSVSVLPSQMITSKITKGMKLIC